MVKQESEADEYIRGVQERQRMRNEASGVDSDDVPGAPAVANVQPLEDGAVFKASAPAGTPSHALLDVVAASQHSFPVDVQIVETLGGEIVATVQEQE